MPCKCETLGLIPGVGGGREEGEGRGERDERQEIRDPNPNKSKQNCTGPRLPGLQATEAQDVRGLVLQGSQGPVRPTCRVGPHVHPRLPI